MRDRMRGSGPAIPRPLRYALRRAGAARSGHCRSARRDRGIGPKEFPSQHARKGCPLQREESKDPDVERPAQDRTKATSDIPPEIAEQIIHQKMEPQYRETLDQPVGMLGNQTPRQAAKSVAGRRKVAAWIKYLENQSAKQPNSADPMATYSFEWMWHELGVIDLHQ